MYSQKEVLGMAIYYTKETLLTVPKRLQRMMMRLQNYQLNLVYKRGQEMYIADTLSRAHLPVPGSKNELEFI